MSMPYKKACYFCGGEYIRVTMPDGMENYDVSTLVINKKGESKLNMAKTLVFRCVRCGNLQAFSEQQLEM